MVEARGTTWRAEYGELAEREQFRVGYVGSQSYEGYFPITQLSDLIAVLTAASSAGIPSLSTGTSVQARTSTTGFRTEVAVEPRSDQFPVQIMRFDRSLIGDLISTLTALSGMLSAGPGDWDNTKPFPIPLSMIPLNDIVSSPQLSATIETVVGGMELGGQNIRLDALAAGQRLRATLAGSESETAQGVTVSAMSARDTTSAVSIGTATFTQAGSIITTSVAHNLAVGDPVSFGTITTTTGLSAGDVYFVREVLSSTTFTVTTAVGGALRTFTNDGSTVAVYRRERAWNRQASALNAGIRVTETRPVQANASYPRWEYIRPDPSIVTYAPGSYTGTAMRVETEYGGTVLGVLARYGAASTCYNVYVDGRLAKKILAADFTGASVTSGNLGRITLTFPTARRRAIVVEMESGSDEFPGFETQGGQPLIFPTSTDKGPRVLIVGDSFTEGTGAGTSRPYARWLQKLMGWIDVWKGGSGSTGYTNDGQRLALIDRYSNDIIAQQAQIVIIAMGINDSSQTLSTVLADAETIWDATLASSYTRELVIVGPWPNNGGAGTVSAPLVALDEGLAALAVEKGVRYISPISEGWQFSLADATHPDPVGHEYIAWRLAGHLSVPYIAA